MIVAYDLRYANDHFAGIGTHAFALIDELLGLPGDERYVLLWNRGLRQTRYDFERLRANPRVTWVERAIDPVQPWGTIQTGAWLRGLEPSVYFSPFALRPVASGVPEVLTLHDVEPLRYRRSPVWNLLYEASLGLAFRARMILTSSEFSRSEILALTHARPERVRAILLGVLPWRPGLTPSRPAGLAPGRFALLVGDNRPRKNLGVLARAWAAMGATPPLALVAAGPVEPAYPSITGLATAAGARGVQHLGWVEPSELAWLYANAELLLFPSVYEGFGLPLAEGLAHGLPIVASDIPAFREVGAAAADYVDPRDPAAWASEVTRLAGDAAARDAMRPAARARAGELTYRRTAEAALAVLREVARPRS